MKTEIDNEIAGQGRIELFGFPTSPYTLKVAGYLGLKGLNYRFIGVSPITYREVAFATRRQVPVLKVNDEWRQDSDDIGVWLDALFPDTPLLPSEPSRADVVHAINEWINHAVIPGMFRLSVDWPSLRTGLHNGWSLSRTVNKSTHLPLWVRLLWPVLVRKAGFIHKIVAPLDRSEPLPDFQQRLIQECVEHLAAGPFLGGEAEPTLADASLYPLVLFGGQLGLKGDTPWLESEPIRHWAARMESRLPLPPTLIH